jgi:class 3 adenylate cyclase/tetratricopeptide (TPR) repeat protein
VVSSAAERRQLTVVFFDMVGSSALSTKLDPEEHREVLGAFHACCASAIKRFDGMVAQYLGDGVLAYFGYPIAHEDDAERAVRTGLAVISAVSALEPAPGVIIQARIGIATGLVVVGDLVREGVTQENAAIGETTNLASRLQAIAEPNTVVVAPQTLPLLGGMFEYRELGIQTLKGFGEPVQVHEVLRESQVENRFEARHPGGTSPLLGREEELEVLMRRWTQAKRGDGRVVVITGEAGIGKSRLTQAFYERLSDEPHTRLVYHCSPYHRDVPLHPIITQITRAAEIEQSDGTDLKLDKLETLLAKSSTRSANDTAIIASLLSIPGSHRYPLPTLTPQQLKERTFGALIAQLQGLCAVQPLLMVFEDLHWVDATTLDLLGRTIQVAPTVPLLLLATARPEFAQHWPNDRHISTIMLTRLGRFEVQTLVSEITGGKALPDEVINNIVQRTDGVPLFVEELTKTVMESGLLRDSGKRYELIDPLPHLSIPATLHASLLARLDRLASTKDVAQIGSAIGRVFSYELIAAVSRLPEKELRVTLDQLTRAELVFQRGEIPHATFLFKHALVQDAAYGSLVRSRRHQIHAQIAHVLETDHPHIAADEPATLAFHYTEAGLFDQAIDFWSTAGQFALARFANDEAVNHFSQALRLLVRQGDRPEHARRKLDLSLQYGLPLIATRGYASREVENHYMATVDLAKRLGDRDAEFASTRSLWNCAYDEADLDWSLDLANRLVHLAETAASDEKRALAFRALGSTLMSRADLTASEMAFDRCLSTGGQLSYSTWIKPHGEVPVLVAQQYKGFIWALRGQLDDALQALTTAATDAETVRHPITRAFAKGLLSTVLLFRRDYADCIKVTRESHELCKEYGFAFWSAQCEIFEGVAGANLGGGEEGLQMAERGLRNWTDTGAQLHVPTWSSFIAEAAISLGQHSRADELISHAIQAVQSTGEFLMVAELERLAAMLLLRRGNTDEGRGMLERARVSAKSNGMVLFELRAAHELAQLLSDKGDYRGARNILQPVLDSFPQNRNGSDYQRALGML